MESKSLIIGLFVGLLLGVGVAYGIPLKPIERNDAVSYEARIEALEKQITFLNTRYNQLDSYIENLPDYSIPFTVDIDEFQLEILYYLSLGYGRLPDAFHYYPFDGTYGFHLDNLIHHSKLDPWFNTTVIEVSKSKLRNEVPIIFNIFEMEEGAFPQLYFNMAEKRIYLLKFDREQEPMLRSLMWWSPQ